MARVSAVVPDHPRRCSSSHLEEEPHANLHYALSRFSVDAAEVWRIGIPDDASKVRVVENIQRLKPRLEISRLGVTEIEPLQNARICCKLAGIAKICEIYR